MAIQAEPARPGMTIRFEGDPGNAFVGYGILAFDISWLNFITLEWNNQQWTYQLLVDYNGFPRHEIRINGTLVYSRDPIDTHPQFAPTDLGWPREVQAGPFIGIVP